MIKKKIIPALVCISLLSSLSIMTSAQAATSTSTATVACTTAISNLDNLIKQGPGNKESVFQDLFTEAASSWTALAACPSADVETLARDNCTNLAAILKGLSTFEIDMAKTAVGTTVTTEFVKGCPAASSYLK